MIFWADACASQYEFIVVNGQTIYDFWISQGSVATVLRWGGQNYIIYVNFLYNVACQKLLKSANVSQSYSKNNTGTVFWDTV